MTSCPWRLTLESEGPRVHQLSRATLARARGPAGSTRCHGRNVPGSACQRCRPEFTGDSGPCPCARVVDQLYWDTHACVQSPRGRPAVPGDSRLGSECLRGRPAVPGHSCFGPRATVSTWFSGRLGPCPRARLSNRCPVRFALLSEGPWGQPAVPATRACVREPAGSTTCSGRLRTVPKGPQCRPTLPGISVSGPGSRVDQLSRANRARVRVPAGTTRLQGDSGPGLRARGVD